MVRKYTGSIVGILNYENIIMELNDYSFYFVCLYVSIIRFLRS